MKSKIIIESDQLTMEEVRVLLQVIRTTEQKVFPEKTIRILADVPDAKMEEVVDMLQSLVPPLPYQYVMRRVPAEA